MDELINIFSQIFEQILKGNIIVSIISIIIGLLAITYFIYKIQRSQDSNPSEEKIVLQVENSISLIVQIITELKKSIDRLSVDTVKTNTIQNSQISDKLSTNEDNIVNLIQNLETKLTTLLTLSITDLSDSINNSVAINIKDIDSTLSKNIIEDRFFRRDIVASLQDIKCKLVKLQEVLNDIEVKD